MSDLVKRLKCAAESFPIIEDRPDKLLSEALDHILKMEREADNDVDIIKRQTKRIVALRAKLDRVRSDFCMFWKAQGCSCCEDTESSEKYGRRLAESLDIPLFDDGSGVDYYSVCESALGDEDES